MDKEIEKIILKSFFTKRLQDRILFELTSTKKRKDALSRLCHSYRTILREEYLVDIPKSNSNSEAIEKLLKQNGARNSWYVILWDEEIDGKELPLLTALKHAVGMGMPSIISCTPDKLAYFKAVQEVLPSQRF